MGSDKDDNSREVPRTGDPAVDAALERLANGDRPYSRDLVDAMATMIDLSKRREPDSSRD